MVYTHKYINNRRDTLELLIFFRFSWSTCPDVRIRLASNGKRDKLEFIYVTDRKMVFFGSKQHRKWQKKKTQKAPSHTWPKRKLNFPFDLVQCVCCVYVHCPNVPFCPNSLPATAFVLLRLYSHSCFMCIYLCATVNVCIPFEYVMNEWMNKKTNERMNEMLPPKRPK